LKTLLITCIFPPLMGGSGRWFWELYRRLPRGAFLVAAAELTGPRETEGASDVRVVRLPLALRHWGIRTPASAWAYGRAVWRLLTLARRERVGMIHSGRPLPEGVMALALRLLTGTPYICYVHGEEMSIAAASRELAWLARRVLDRAELVIANSRNTGSILRRDWQLTADGLGILHPGVDTRLFVPAARDLRIREGLGWGDRPVILTVGRLQKRKGHDRLIEALAVIKRAVPDVLYAVVGDGEERTALEELSRREHVADSVQFLGELEDARMVQCYQQCDVFALPNREVDGDIEGFGIVLLEAQACGKPVVAGMSGGTAETMRVGESGEIVDCRTAGPLAESVSRLLLDPDRRRRMGEAGRAWVVERFDWSVLSRQAEQLFARALLRSRPGAG
jgi:phosphatidylinositol alpha-1,6-mannosyltransferase